MSSGQRIANWTQKNKPNLFWQSRLACVIRDDRASLWLNEMWKYTSINPPNSSPFCKREMLHSICTSESSTLRTRKQVAMVAVMHSVIIIAVCCVNLRRIFLGWATVDPCGICKYEPSHKAHRKIEFSLSSAINASWPNCEWSFMGSMESAWATSLKALGWVKNG